MAKNYTRPLAEVYQLLEVTQQATGDHLSACIVGPEYDVYRYGIEDDVHGETYIGGSNPTGQQGGWSAKPTPIAMQYTQDPMFNYSIDEKSIAVYAEKLEAQVYNQGYALHWTPKAGYSRVLVCDPNQIITEGETAPFTRLPQAGDKVYIANASSNFTTKVINYDINTVVKFDNVTGELTLEDPVITPYLDSSSGKGNVLIYALYSGYLKSSAWTYDKTTQKVTVQGDLRLTDEFDGKTYKVKDGMGMLYPEFRVQVSPKDEDEDIFEIRTVADIHENFGTVDVNNDLAYGCYCALKGAAGRSIYAIRTQGTNKEAFEAAMKKTEFDSSLYSFVPLTDDSDVAEVVVNYNAAMSAPDVKMWRRTIMGISNPGEYEIATKGNDGKVITANVVVDENNPKAATITITSGNISFKEVALETSYVDMKPYDKIKVGSKVYIITSRTSTAATVIAEEGNAATAENASIVLVKAATVANATQYITAIARKYNTRRASLVFCDGGTTIEDDRIVEIPNKFLAAEVAGIASAVVPQQSITHTEIQAITKASKMYTQYTTAQQDDIAAAGVLVITQDTKGTACYIRHQLTTEMDKGNLYYEESCTRNLDNISYALADVVNKYIGKANVTTSALRAIKIDVTNTLTGFTQDSQNDLVGPSLVDWQNLEVYQDPTFKDRVIITVDLYLPLPLNNIKLYAMAYIATVSI